MWAKFVLPFRQEDGEPIKWLAITKMLHLSPKSIGFLSGFCGGLADTLLNYPPYGLHLRLQSKVIINPLKNPTIYWPRELFRGVGPYSLIIPVTCIADGVSTYLKERYQWQDFYATFTSGMVGGVIVSSPTSNVIIFQQKYKFTPFQAIMFIYTQHGVYQFTNAMSLYMLREAFYALSVFWAKPTLQRNHEFFANGLVASIAVGIVATLISQPLDTTATYQVGQEVRLSPWQSIVSMYRSEGGGWKGLKRFYWGTWLRGYAVVAGIFVMASVSEYVKWFFNV
jgi:hypothetical protein